MTLTDLLSDSFVPTPDVVKTWKQRGVDIAATPFPADAIKSKLEFLRKHVADYAAAQQLDLATEIVSISREKVADFGIGELLVLASGHRLAAAACEFRVLDETPAQPAVPEKPVAEAAAPKKAKPPKAKRSVTDEEFCAGLQKLYDDAAAERAADQPNA